MSAEPLRVSVVIPTYQRAHDCHAAVMSALEQELPPLEVLVCDDGSTDETEALFTRLAHEDPRVRYLRLAKNRGTPAPARNLGIANALGHWIAFLDSDDRWRVDKLAVQQEAISSGAYDVVASDATKGSGGPYFGLSVPSEPTRGDFLTHNPIIVSSAVARRSVLLAGGGFAQSVGGFKITGVEDYGVWLKLADQGARFLVIPEPLVTYADSGDRMSGAIARQEAGVAAVRWRLWCRRPGDLAVLRSAIRATLDAIRSLARGRRRSST
jgi:glycosyltransferase involved in cell wall biosynthesis